MAREPGVEEIIMQMVVGIEEAIDYNATPFETVVRDVDVVVDTVGGETTHPHRPHTLYAGRSAPGPGIGSNKTRTRTDHLVDGVIVGHIPCT